MLFLVVLLVCFTIVNGGQSSVIKSSKAADELRCHCNLPSCVTTGYMCKSTKGTCFSEIVDRTDLSKSRHGCIELLTEQAECQNQPGRHHQVQQQHLSPEQPLVLCCQDDLCNYGAQPVLNLHLVHHSRSNSHHHGHHINNNDSVTSSGDAVIQQQQSSNDLWLKAATIAVPIAGGCILVLLVLLAIRLLRRDRLENNNIMAAAAGAVGGGGGGGRIMKPSAEVYHQQVQHWTSYNKDRQPMLPGQHNHHHHIVYLPTTKAMHSHPPKRMMWAKSITAKPGVAVRHHHV